MALPPLQSWPAAVSYTHLIGKVLAMANNYGNYPCYRVVNHTGRLVPGWFEQKSLLLKEGISFKDDFHVDLSTCQWDY